MACAPESLALGVDRLDYTKGIVERLMQLSSCFEDHPWYRERLTMVQIAAPSRTRIPSYAEFANPRRRDRESASTRGFRRMHWKPIVLIERQCNHEEVHAGIAPPISAW